MHTLFAIEITNSEGSSALHLTPDEEPKTYFTQHAAERSVGALTNWDRRLKIHNANYQPRTFRIVKLVEPSI
jgi:hypothetical protein